jgi:hypothetical protein
MSDKPTISTADLLKSLRESVIREREDGWITISEAAEAWGVSEPTALRRLSGKEWEASRARVGRHICNVYRRVS